MSKIVVWVDPGLVTGVALWSDDPGSPLHYHPEVNEFDFRALGMWLSGVRKHDQVSIGWERFVITARTARLTSAPWSLEVTGMCRWFAIAHRWMILGPAGSSDRASKELVDTLMWCPRGMRDDGMSACQHLLAWMLRTGSAPPYARDMIRAKLDHS